MTTPAGNRPLAPANPPVQPMLRLRRMSRWMRALVALGAAALLFSTASAWLRPESARDARLQELASAAGVQVEVPPSPAARTALEALALPGSLLALFTLLQAWRLFGGWGRGEVFGPVAVRHIRALAWALIATALWHIANATLNVLLLTWHNPPGHRQLSFGVSWEDYTGVLFGGLLLAMAWAMTEARRIEQDNAGFV